MKLNTFIQYITLGALLCLVAACSNEQVYESIQHNRQQHCQTLPEPQQQDCLDAHDEVYDDYAEKRKELL